MATAAPRPEAPATPEELDERTSQAWTAYSASLRELSGADYERAESRCWERLQGELEVLDRRRAELTAAARRRARDS
jgi:hypothetical protein